jgi:transglutaminase-like putative cysteine protease
MWTEAWLDGKWIALDSTLNTGFGAGHLKVIDTALADDGLTPALAFAPMLDLVKNVKIEVVRVER